MSYYDGAYQSRLNRYGLDYQSRIQNQRERIFEQLLLKSLYRVDFIYNDTLEPGVFERYKQDETETLHYLLTRTSLNIPNGTILMIPDKDKIEKPWMVYYIEHINASGYNRYIVLKMSHFITWKDKDEIVRTSWAYLYGQENNMLKNEIRSRSRSDVLYSENLKLNFFVMPRNEYIKRDIYLTVGEEPFKEGYRVTGYDIQSSEGIEYVSIDPIYLHDKKFEPGYTNDYSEVDWLNQEG